MSVVSAADPTVARTSVMTTGPSGLVLGRGPSGPVTIRLFRPQPTRLFLAVPDYAKWLLAFRSVCLGAHVSVVTADHRSWLTLADTIRACGGTIDILRDADALPGRGRPFRPSLVIDERVGTTQQLALGPWQALLSIGDPAAGRAVNDMRNADLTMVAPVEGRTADNLRRAYALSAQQVRLVGDLAESEVALASVRRLVRVPLPPSPTEYRLLFGR